MPNKYLDSVGLTEYTGLVKTALNAKAPLSSPALTGTPTAPTASAGTDTTQIATTEFVQDAIDSEETRADGAYVPLAGGTITGNLSVNGTITGNVTGNASTATNATNDANGNPIASTYLPLAGGTLTGAVNGVTPTAGDDSTKLATTEYVREEVRQHSGIPIGHIYFSVNPNIPQGSLPLFGGEFSRETYSDLWAWVQQQAGYCKTEAEWQALATNNNNNVPYYSDGDGSTTFRVPSLRCWVKGADGTVVEVGSYLEAGLPNITGELDNLKLRHTDWNGLKGSFYEIARGTDGADGSSLSWKSIGFNASRSNSIYGNSATVQPESIVGMWLVKAYGTIEDTGTIDEQQYIDDRIAALPNTFLPLAGGIMAGKLNYIGSNERTFSLGFSDAEKTNVNFGWDFDNGDGSGVAFRNADYPYSNSGGGFSIWAKNSTAVVTLDGKTNGKLTWNGGDVLTNAIVGKYYNASWIATSSSANEVRLTNILTNLPVGTYIALCKLPATSTGSFLMSLFMSGATTILDNVLGSLNSQQVSTRIVRVTSASNSIYLKSSQSSACTFTYLGRGGLSLVRLA